MSRFCSVLSAVVLMTLSLMPTASATTRPPASAGAGLGFELDTATIPELQQRMEKGTLDSVRLTAAYLHRIAAVDRAVHAVLTIDPGVLAQAVASDLRRRTGRLRGALDGIPVLLKDNVDTRATATTAGSRALAGRPPSRDAKLVTQLRDAGAVVLGKTNLSEWANYRSTHATSGWSGVGGQTNNPYVLDRNPCGSSSGSAAAVAASLAQVAIGTETDGSIMCPSGANGVVGEKPSRGLVSRSGVVPISAEQDTAGPMARNVIDAAIVLSALQGRDPSDPTTLTYPANQPSDYAARLDPAALHGARIGVWRRAGLNPDVDRVVASSVDTLRAQGVTVLEVEPPYQAEIDQNESSALPSEFNRDIGSYLRTRPGHPQTLAQLIEFNRNDPVELSKFGQELFVEALVAPGTDDPRYQQSRATATDLARRSIDETLSAQHLDAIVGPSNGPAWLTSYGHGDDYLLGTATPAAVAGYPNVSVPAGFAGELPLGLSFMAGRWADSRVLSLAAAFEQATHARRAPRYLATTG